MEHDHMIEALATNGSNHSLYIGSLPRRARCRQDFADAHVSHLFSEVIAKDPIAVPQQVTRELVNKSTMPREACTQLPITRKPSKWNPGQNHFFDYATYLVFLG
jgi:hypothetical protein